MTTKRISCLTMALMIITGCLSLYWFIAYLTRLTAYNFMGIELIHVVIKAIGYFLTIMGCFYVAWSVHNDIPHKARYGFIALLVSSLIEIIGWILRLIGYSANPITGSFYILQDVIYISALWLTCAALSSSTRELQAANSKKALLLLAVSAVFTLIVNPIVSAIVHGSTYSGGTVFGWAWQVCFFFGSYLLLYMVAGKEDREKQDVFWMPARQLERVLGGSSDTSEFEKKETPNSKASSGEEKMRRSDNASFCMKCGSRLPPDGNFCPRCGRRKQDLSR